MEKEETQAASRKENLPVSADWGGNGCDLSLKEIGQTITHINTNLFRDEFPISLFFVLFCFVF